MDCTKRHTDKLTWPNQSAAAKGLSAVRSGVAGIRERTVRSTVAAEAFAELGSLGGIARTVTPTLIGYFPKRTMKRPDWLKAAGVEEVCSVSTCVSDGPEGWIDHWRHNDMWAYDTPELAWSIVPEGARGEFDLYAYQMYPVQFAEGQQQSFEFPALHVTPLPSSFERLGFDVVSRSCGSSFECSPLSCNHMAEQVAVTRQCLVDDVDVAFRLAAEFEAGGCEPGPYCVIEVWRQR